MIRKLWTNDIFENTTYTSKFIDLKGCEAEEQCRLIKSPKKGPGIIKHINRLQHEKDALLYFDGESFSKRV